MEAILSEAVCGCFEHQAKSPKKFIAAMFSNQETKQEKKLKAEINKLKKMNASLAKKSKNLLKMLEKLQKRTALILPVEQPHSESKKDENTRMGNVPFQTPDKILFEDINVHSTTKKRGRPGKNKLIVSSQK